jgi:hypothetical protein
MLEILPQLVRARTRMVVNDVLEYAAIVRARGSVGVVVGADVFSRTLEMQPRCTAKT